VSEAIRATFARRDTPIPRETPIALTSAFAGLPEKKTQWTAFVKKNNLETHDELHGIVEAIAAFIEPVLTALASGSSFEGKWPAGGPWSL
jgi:hypothetical protein